MHTEGMCAKLLHGTDGEMCAGIASDGEHGINFAAGQQVNRAGVAGVIAWQIPVLSPQRIREPELPGKYFSGTGHIIVTPHRHDREFRVFVEIFGDGDCLVDVVVLAERLGHTHTEEDDPETAALHHICSFP